MNSIRLLKLGVRLEFNAATRLPSFVGNTIRGALGSALLERGGGALSNVFKNDSAESAPNPFVISAPYPSKGEYSEGDILAFTLTLIGSACEYDGEVAEALKDMCRGKLESARVAGVTQVYDRVWSDGGAASIPYRDTITLNFITPTEIMVRKKPLATLDFDAFTDSLFGRIAGLFHISGGEFVLPYRLITAKPLIKHVCRIKRLEFHTNGQPINGFTGKADFYGDVTRYLPYIDLGSQIHIGKKTTRGCGLFCIEGQSGSIYS